MDYKHLNGQGLEPIRRRPGMYIGAADADRSAQARLLEAVVRGVAQNTPPPRETRILLWREAAVTVAYDGRSLPIEPFAPRAEDVPHPSFYWSFMDLYVWTAEFEPLLYRAILNALSERLVVSTMHDGHRYRVVFSKGMLVTLLGRADCNDPLGDTWFTFRLDPTVITGEVLTLADIQGIAERVEQADGVRIRFGDRTAESADWY